MTTSQIVALGFTLLFLGLILVFALLISKKKAGGTHLRAIPAFQHLWRAIGLAVEDGTRLHFSIGRGAVNSPESASAFASLSMLTRIMRIISISDKAPVATAGDGALAVLTRDTLRAAYQDMGQATQYQPVAGRLTGITPFAFAAGIQPIIADEEVSANVLIGHFGPEIALIMEAGERKNNLTLAGSDHLAGQAVLYTGTQEPLIGEEVYAGSAYLQAGTLHTASLRAQDIMRWLVIIAILGGAVLRFLGFIPFGR
ncbi:MAG: hypothetical protein Fur0018_05090 [Anaerolineales bacterium]